MAVLCIDSLTPIKVARHYDGAADVIEFDVGRWIEAYPALTEYRVEVTSPGGAVYFPEAVDLNGHILKWTIMPSDTGTAGDGEYQIVATGASGERKTSASARFVVREIMDGTAGETPPDPAKPWVDEVVKAAQRVEDATVHPPIIGDNGNWWLWDFGAAAYVDSGKPSQGSGSGGGGIAQETDPTVPGWAKQPNPPTYTAQDVGARPADWLPTSEEIGAQPAGNYALKSEIPAVPVQSVNGKTGAVELTAKDVGAASKESVERLNEEKADQFTVGEGLQMSEDRVLSKSNRITHKLVKSVTIETAVDVIALDGFSLRNAIVEFIVPLATTTAPIFVYINDIASVNFVEGISNASETVSLIHVNTLSGKIRATDAFISPAGRFGQEKNSIRYYGTNGTSTPLDSISKVKAYANKTDATFPAGTVVNIYEVM